MKLRCLADDSLIIHHIMMREGDWWMSYEIRGEWKPRTVILKDKYFSKIDLLEEL